MSSWDRSRSIPWSLIRQDGDADAYKEEVFRSLQKEMITTSDEEGTSKNSEGTKTTSMKGVPYSTGELFKTAAFGATLGSITGAVFGFMDSMRTASENEVLKKASNQAKSRYLIEGTTRSATIFGLFFAGFHTLKYGLRVAANPGEVTEIGVAGVISVGALAVKPAFRPSIPYAAMLIAMESIQFVWRKSD